MSLDVLAVAVVLFVICCLLASWQRRIERRTNGRSVLPADSPLGPPVTPPVAPPDDPPPGPDPHYLTAAYAAIGRTPESAEDEISAAIQAAMYAAKRCELGMVVTIFDPHGLRQGEPILTTTPVPTAKPGVIHSGYGFCKIEDKRPVAEKPPGRPATVPLRLGRPAE